MVSYDQLGAGKSDRTTDTTLLVVPRYVDELTSHRRALKCDKVLLNDNSRGAIVAVGKEIFRWVETLLKLKSNTHTRRNANKNLAVPACKPASEE